ncbi:class I SAM-dependent methyltransferase [Siccirubricoccus deserti]|uniref:Class I SAM-dependent methyltransferase n=2 Tax=Siccirubricoccus deserti TaxID=2013562 RepID=A0A9X0R4B9_9PROT|nr:class I SAM-dependent methyltransferase [Siccirubricoccus deserti]
MGRWSRLLAPLLLDFAGGAPENGGRVLDVGCGTGSLTFAAAGRYPRAEVVGCDIAEPLLAHARAVNPEPGRVRFEHGDACALPYPDGAFDLVLSSLVLMFVPDGALAAREMARVARPGATVAATAWDFRGGAVYHRLVADTAAALDPVAAAWRERVQRAPGVRLGDLAALWRGAGLSGVRDGSLTIRMDYAGIDDFWGALTRSGQFGSFFRTLSPERQRVIADAVRAAYLSGDPDGPRSFAATAWAVLGTR